MEMNDVDINIADVHKIRDLIDDITTVLDNKKKKDDEIHRLQSDAFHLLQKIVEILRLDELISKYGRGSFAMTVNSPLCDHEGRLIIDYNNRICIVRFERKCNTAQCHDRYMRLGDSVIALYVLVKSLPDIKSHLQDILDKEHKEYADSERQYDILMRMIERVEAELKPFTLARDLTKTSSSTTPATKVISRRPPWALPA
jgi:hypothetical protein